MKNVNVNYGYGQPQLTYSQIKKSFGFLNAQLTSITNTLRMSTMFSLINWLLKALNQNIT